MFTRCEVQPVKLKQISENGKRFYVTPNDKRYPSITTILSSKPNPALDEWRRRVGEKEASRVSRQACSSGTSLHSITEHYLKNEDISNIHPLEKQRFNDFKKVLTPISDIYLQEEYLYSDHLRIAGSPDCIGRYNGKKSVIDFKTSKKPKKKEWIDNYFMQCSGYAIMFEELYKIPVTQLVVLISVEDDQPQIFIEHRDNWIDQLIDLRDIFERNQNTKYF